MDSFLLKSEIVFVFFRKFFPVNINIKILHRCMNNISHDIKVLVKVIKTDTIKRWFCIKMNSSNLDYFVFFYFLHTAGFTSIFTSIYTVLLENQIPNTLLHDI